MEKYKVIKDIIPEPFMFKPTCKVGDTLYLSSDMLFDEKHNFICAMGSQIQIEHTEKII